MATAERKARAAKADDQPVAVKLTRLEELRLQAGKLRGELGAVTYERVQLAVAVYEDDDWVLDSFAGNQEAAAEFLEKKYLPDMLGAIEFYDAMRIIKAIPDQADWKRLDYDFKDLYAEMEARERKCDEEAQPKATKKRVPSVRQFREQEAAIADLTSKSESLVAIVKAKDDRLTALEKANDELRQDNARLKGRIDELERWLASR